MQLRNKTRQRKNVYDGENAIPQVAKPTAQKKKKKPPNCGAFCHANIS